MKKTRLALITVFAFLAVIGMTWALFIFEKEASSTNDGIDVDIAGYADVGTVEISNVKVGGSETGRFVFDNATDMPLNSVITFNVKHVAPTGDGAELPVGTATYEVTVTFNELELDNYVTFTVDASSWSTPGADVTLTATPAWVNGKIPESISEWNTLNALISDSSKVLITATVTYA